MILLLLRSGKRSIEWMLLLLVLSLFVLFLPLLSLLRARRRPISSPAPVVPNKLEIMLRRAGRELADHQVARFFKVPEEMAQTPCDFFGYTCYGRAILIEAKMVHRSSLPIGASNGLQTHQWNELADANRAGALALIVWANGDEIAAISFDVAEFLSRDRRSIPWDGIDQKYRTAWSGSDIHLRVLDHWLPLAQPSR